MDYELNKKYISNIPLESSDNSGAIFLLVGLILMYGALAYAFGASLILLGIVLIVISVVLIVIGISKIKKAKASVYVTDEEYDQNVKTNLNDIEMRAIDALGVDETEVCEIKPIRFEGYSYKDATKIKQGKDGLYRSNKYQAVVIMFSANEAHVYKYKFDTIEKRSSEETEVYFYKDIVSVSTTSDVIDVLGKRIEAEFFTLTTSGGNTLSVSLLDNNGSQKSINAMRALLREKKQA